MCIYRRARTGLFVGALAGLASLFAFSNSASAQLIVGVDDPQEGIWNLNPSDNSVQTFLPGNAGTNLATDEVNQILYFMSNTVQLWKWDYSAPGNLPVFINNLTNSAGGTGFLSINGIGFDSVTGKLFGSRSLNSSSGSEGFYEIDPATGISTVRISTPTNTYDFGGIDRDASTGRFFANGDPGVSGTSQPGIYEVNFTTNTFSLLAPYPVGATDMDGLAAGNGKIYMIEDRAVQAGGKIHVFNTVTMQYEAPLQVPWFFTETFSGGTYSPTLAAALQSIPEPATAGALLLGGLTAFFRRPKRKVAVIAASAVVAGATIASTSSTASAQLVMATDGLNEGMYATDLSTVRPTDEFPLPANIATWQNIFVGRSIRGMAADETTRTLYWLDLDNPFGGLPQSILYKMSYDTMIPQVVGVVRNSTSGNEMGFQGLAIDTASRKMYGTYNIGGTPGEGIYEITNWESPSGNTVFASPRLLYNTLPGGEGEWDLESLDYDPVTNKVYGINDDSGAPPDGLGLYSFDLTNGTANFVVRSPNYRRIETDFDGLATGGGKAYFTTDEEGFIYAYDFATGTYSDFLSPVLEGDLFGGAAYAPGLVPEPGTASLAVAGVLALAARRRRGH